MKDSHLPLLSQGAGWNGRWLYVLLLLGFMHVLMDARYRVASLFPSKAVGFAVLGVLYLVLSLVLTRSRPPLPTLFLRLDAWVRSLLSPLQRMSLRVLLPAVCVILLLMTLGSCLARWHYIAGLPIAPRLADMLPLIQQACDAFLDGHNPYEQAYKMPWTLPLTFWPGMWMPYVPLRWIGSDLRLLHLAVVVFIAAIFAGFLVQSLCHASRKRSATIAATFAALFLFLFSTEPIFFAGIGHTPPQWAWGAVMAAAILYRRPYHSAIGLGLLLASRQTTVIMAPLVALYWLRSSGSLRTTLKLSAVAVASYLVLCGPFLISAPYEFIVAPVKHYSALGDWDFSRGGQSYSADTIGLAYAIRCMRVPWFLSASMVVTLVMTFMSAWWRLRDDADLLLHMSLASVAVTLVSPIPWHYEYFPCLLLISFAALAAARREDTLCEQHARQVSSEAAPGASPDEPSA